MTEVIDLAEAIGLADAARLMRGRGGRPASVETVRRWANPRRGCYPQGKGGPQLLLRTVRVNGDLLTTPGWVAEFERRRVELGVRAPAPAPARPEGRRAAAHRRADERLRKGGVGKGS